MVQNLIPKAVNIMCSPLCEQYLLDVDEEAEADERRRNARALYPPSIETPAEEKEDVVEMEEEQQSQGQGDSTEL